MKPVFNPAWPIEAITDQNQLMAIAIGMEREAAARYEELAGAMDQAGAREMSSLFRDLAAMERAHEAGIGRWASRDGLGAPQPAGFAWELPESFGDEAAPSPYRALAIAVRNEERAFAFYAYLAAMAPDGETRLRAERLAGEELNHVAQLRAMRRRAFHDERRSLRPVPRSIEDLRRTAAVLEDELARLGEPRSILCKADEIAETWLMAAEGAKDETLLREAQELAGRAVARVVHLRSQFSG
ncbi:MAG: ferritin family protein [Alphaproteobacteria bacterium]|nr:ferritin family protein [Alphaproteobacteria bacterium]